MPDTAYSLLPDAKGALLASTPGASATCSVLIGSGTSTVSRSRAPPPFMSIFLLRGDVPEQVAVDDPAAQREFVAWCLLRGRNESPGVWQWNRAAAEVAISAAAPAASRADLVPRIGETRYTGGDEEGGAFTPFQPIHLQLALR
jgi:hypothetical protein